MDVRELAYRENDGIEVTLLWHPADGRLTVAILDCRSEEHLELDAPRDKALDVFYHPYAYTRSSATFELTEV